MLKLQAEEFQRLQQGGCGRKQIVFVFNINILTVAILVFLVDGCVVISEHRSEAYVDSRKRIF